MTIEEFKKKVSEMVDELPKDQHVFVLFYDEVQKDASYCGIGCAACAFDMMLKMAIAGQFKHNGPEPDINGTHH